jgi:hypothetical protein
MPREQAPGVRQATRLSRVIAEVDGSRRWIPEGRHESGSGMVTAHSVMVDRNDGSRCRANSPSASMAAGESLAVWLATHIPRVVAHIWPVWFTVDLSPDDRRERVRAARNGVVDPGAASALVRFAILDVVGEYRRDVAVAGRPEDRKVVSPSRAPQLGNGASRGHQHRSGPAPPKERSRDRPAAQEFFGPRRSRVRRTLRAVRSPRSRRGREPPAPAERRQAVAVQSRGRAGTARKGVRR